MKRDFEQLAKLQKEEGDALKKLGNEERRGKPRHLKFMSLMRTLCVCRGRNVTSSLVFFASSLQLGLVISVYVSCSRYS